MRLPSATRRRRSIASAALCVPLFGCGQSIRTIYDPPPKDAAADTSDPEPTNCAYPRAGDPNTAFLEKTSALARPGCRYRLGDEKPLPFDPGFAAFAFSYDVNGDEIGDIFFWQSPFAELGGLQLAVSQVTDGSLAYVRADCDALGIIPGGRVFVRDLNYDNVPDLVVGPTSFDQNGGECPAAGGDTALKAFVNLPSGFEEVFRHEWPETGGCNIKTTLLDVDVADFGGAAEGLADIAFGYDRVFASGMELGVAVARIDKSLPQQNYSVNDWVGFTGAPGPNSSLGQVAVGGDSETPWMFVPGTAGEPSELAPGRVVRWQGSDFSEHSLELEMPTDAPEATGGYDAWIVPSAAPPQALAVLYGNEVAFYSVSDPTRTPVPIFSSFPTVWSHYYAEPLGGGNAGATRFMIDIDGDGDIDFVEHGGDRATIGLFSTIHSGESGPSFGMPIDVPVSLNIDRWAESPFVAVGPAQGAIFLNIASGPEFGQGESGPPTFQALECASE